MNTADPSHRRELNAAFRAAATSGDLARFISLATQFPDHLESMREDDLLDLAVGAKQNGLVLHLILHHGFQVSPSFEKHRKPYGGDLFAEGVNEYHQTLEVMAEAVIGWEHPDRRSLACHELRALVSNLPGNPLYSLDPEFLTAAVNGDLQTFVAREMADERFERCENRHSGSLLKVLGRQAEPIAEHAKTVLRDTPAERANAGAIKISR